MIFVCAEPLIILVISSVAKIPQISKEQIDVVMGCETNVESGTSKKFRMTQGPFGLRS